MEYVHYCDYCGWSRPAKSATMLAPNCEACGCLLQASLQSEYARATGGEDGPGLFRRPDSTALFAALMVVPVLLPLLGLRLEDVAFGLAGVLLAFAALRCAAAAGQTVTRRRMWLDLSFAAGLGASASALAIVKTIAGLPAWMPLAVGYCGSLALLVGIGRFAHASLVHGRRERAVDALLVCVPPWVASLYVLGGPWLLDGDPSLSIAFVVDLLAALLVLFSLVTYRAPAHRRTGWWLLAACAAAASGQGLLAASSAGQVSSVLAVSAVVWASAGCALAAAASHERRRAEAEDEPLDETSGARWLWRRVLLPVVATLSPVALAFGTWAVEGRLSPASTIFLSCSFVLIVGLAVGGPAYLVVEHGRLVTRERALRHEATRRSEELEALTGLATTMTQTLDEAPIVEQALGVLHLAARATSSAVHAETGGRATLQAAGGQWVSEGVWAATSSALAEEATVETRGGRQIMRLPLVARGSHIGLVTLIRPASDPLPEEKLLLLGLLVDQMAVAVQNARDYREKLEQASRDALTGLYNRRFFLEELQKEVQRSDRYGSVASLVIFDVDDFKHINDRYGHAVGDAVLHEIARLADGLLRPTDSLARIGGEEFALLLPETQQLDALLMAERLRTAISRHEILPDRRVTVSGGVSSCPQDATSRDGLQKKADGALYWAKRNGKDLCAVASEVTGVEDHPEGDAMLAHLYALVSSIDAQQLHTRDHCENVAAYAVAIGQALGLDRDRVVRVRRAALLHDIGKVAVSTAILNKAASLDQDEYAEIKLHTVVGTAMLRHAGLLEESLWVRHHHERIDGTGYPDGLAGDDIPLEARILFVADSFEAMTSNRPYRAGMSVEDAVAELRRRAGTQFEPRVVDTLTELIARDELTVQALRHEVSPLTELPTSAGDPEAQSSD
jgi:diguanylate cyclase (GGDEF)-like protein/putative nucleotidyltransferase with HDIG domain